MSTPNLLPSPVPTSPITVVGGPDKETQLKNLLSTPDFHQMSSDEQRNFLAQRYDPRIAQLNDQGLEEFKHRKANQFGIQITNVPAMSNKDRFIEAARPFVSDAVGAGAGALATPETLGTASVPVGIAAKTAVDMGLQKLEDRPPDSFLGRALGQAPGSFGGTLANSAQMLTTNAVLGRILRGVGIVGKAAAEPNVGYLGQKPLTQEIPQTVVDLTKSLGKNLGDEAAKSTWRQYALANAAAYPLDKLFGNALPTELANGVLSGVKIGRAGIKTLLENPRTANILQKVINKEAITEEPGVISKLFTDALNGTTMVKSGPQGDRTVVMKNGEILPAFK